MARKISRANGASWGTGKGLWGSYGSAWLPAKKVWANNGGVWAQAWPPDMAFTSFAVTATTAEPGYGSSLISWAIDTSVPGTVSIQRKTPAGVWSDVYTGQAISGSQTLDPLIPTQGAAGTWQFRAVFIPTHDPTWLTYSSLDNVTVTIPAASLTVTATSGLVYYTSSNMTWSVTGTTPGTVKLQRRLGAGSWSDFATGLAKSGSSSYQLAPAGAANSGTWYYRAVFEPTHDAAWDILSAEDSATITYRTRTNPTQTAVASTVNWNNASWLSNYTPIQRSDASIKIKARGMAAQDQTDLVRMDATVWEWEILYVMYQTGVTYTTSYSTDASNTRTAYTTGPFSSPDGGYTYEAVAAESKTMESMAPYTLWVLNADDVPANNGSGGLYSNQVGWGFNYGPRRVQVVFTFTDGNTLTYTHTHTGRNGGNVVRDATP